MNLGALVLAIALTGSPVAADLGGYLERSAETEFSGEQLVSCETPDGSRSSLFRVAQVDGTVAAWASDDDAPIVTVGPGRSAVIDGEEVEASVIEGTEAVGSDQYEAGDEIETVFLGRPATDVSLLRDGSERVRLTIDRATGSVVRTRTFDGAGQEYCDRRLLSFDTENVEIPIAAVPVTVEDAALPIEDVPEVLPETIEGFRLADTYALDDGSLSYYTDGFFSAGVVLTDRPLGLGSDDLITFERNGGEYSREYQAGSVTVTWVSASGNMAVIGDLPPDLLEALVDELPAPVQEGFFGRIWSRLFG